MNNFNQRLMILQSCILLQLGVALGAPVQCSYPTGEQLAQQLNQMSSNNEQLLPLQGTTVSEEFLSHQQESLNANHACPSQPASGSNDNVNDRSLCPWYYDITHDAKRYPADLVVAKCKCNNCISNNANQCEPIYYSAPVLTVKEPLECVNGLYVYEEVWQAVSTGCTCAKPRTEVAESVTGGDEPVFD